MKKFDLAYVDYDDIVSIIDNSYLNINTYKKHVVKCEVYAETTYQAVRKIFSKLSGDKYIYFDYYSDVYNWFFRERKYKQERVKISSREMNDDVSRQPLIKVMKVISDESAVSFKDGMYLEKLEKDTMYFEKLDALMRENLDMIAGG